MTLLIILLLFLNFAAASEDAFLFNGFRGANLRRDGISSITPDGVLVMTNATSETEGHAFHPKPLRFKSPSGRTLSFSTTFVFAILPKYSYISGQGLAFVVSRTTNLSTALPSQYLALFDSSDNNGNATNHILAVELDTIVNAEFQDINNNHVGIDVDSLVSTNATAAGYYDDATGVFRNMTLASSQAMQIWVDYNGDDMRMDVTLAPIPMAKPRQPLLSSTVNLSTVMTDTMYPGFSSTNGPFLTTHCVLGWSFKMNGEADALNYTKLPPLPVLDSKGKSGRAMAIWLPLASCAFALLLVAAAVYVVRRKIKYAELLEDWEHEYGPHRFSYKELFRATNGFKDKMLLGSGGFGRVYRGVLPASKIEVAVKRVSHESRQGMKEFVAEIVSIGQLRHRNIVQLLGYSRRKGELLLVYDYMPNSSLDSFLYDESRPTLGWAQRFRVIRGVGSGLLYLHQDWEQIVIHRDIKASNVLLDGELNGRLGDFGLARLYDHGSDPQTTHIVGTMGYLAPELARTGKASTKTDVFAFGAFLLEVACGRRPVEPAAEGEQVLLVDWVLENWKKGSLLATGDPRLTAEECSPAEMEIVLKLGLLCSHPNPDARPSMRQVMQFLDGDATVPDLPPAYTSSLDFLSLMQRDGFDDYMMSSLSSVSHMFALSGGR